MNTKRTQLHNINLGHVPKLRYRLHDRELVSYFQTLALYLSLRTNYDVNIRQICTSKSRKQKSYLIHILYSQVWFVRGKLGW